MQQPNLATGQCMIWLFDVLSNKSKVMHAIKDLRTKSILAGHKQLWRELGGESSVNAISNGTLLHTDAAIGLPSNLVADHERPVLLEKPKEEMRAPHV